MIKRVLIQDRHSEEYNQKELIMSLEQRFENDDIKFEGHSCLSNKKHTLTSYDLIFTHPHINEGGCCRSAMRELYKNRERITNSPKVIITPLNGDNGEIEGILIDGVNIVELTGPRLDVYSKFIKKYLLKS